VKRRDAAMLLAVAGIAAVTLAVALREPGWALVASPAALAVEVAAGMALAVAGVVVRVRGPDPLSGALLCGAGAAWLIAEWNSPGALGALVFTTGIALAHTAPGLVAHALLVHGRGRLGSTAERVTVAAAYAGLTVLAGVGTALVTDPGASGCSTCPPNLLRVADQPDAAAWLERWGLRLGTAALVAAALLALARVWRASPAGRRTILPVLAPGAAFVALMAALQIHDLQRGWDGVDHVDETLRLAAGGALLLVALGVGWQRLAVRRMRGRLAGLVVEMAGAVRPGELRDLMASALDDPTLELLYAFDDGWIDPGGHPRALPATGARTVTSLVQHGEVAATIVHRPGLLDDPRLVEELGRAARLALDHERLQAHQRAQLERLRSARTAIVAAGDAERRRLERDLHDGAQQALAGMAMAIGLARGAESGRHADRLARAQDRVRAALDGVRAMAHATYPAALDEAGLAAALDVLSDWRPNVELGALPAGRLDPGLEANTYFIVAALTRASGDAVVDVNVRREDAELIIDVRTPVALGLDDVQDRVGAVGGRLAVEDTPTGGSQVRVDLPCA
jgi:signal transduction histidine kinase